MNGIRNLTFTSDYTKIYHQGFIPCDVIKSVFVRDKTSHKTSCSLSDRLVFENGRPISGYRQKKTLGG